AELGGPSSVNTVRCPSSVLGYNLLPRKRAEPIAVPKVRKRRLYSGSAASPAAPGPHSELPAASATWGRNHAAWRAQRSELPSGNACRRALSNTAAGGVAIQECAIFAAVRASCLATTLGMATPIRRF